MKRAYLRGFEGLIKFKNRWKEGKNVDELC
jgi:hypothetical protein